MSRPYLCYTPIELRKAALQVATWLNLRPESVYLLTRGITTYGRNEEALMDRWRRSRCSSKGCVAGGTKFRRVRGFLALCKSSNIVLARVSSILGRNFP